MLEGIATRARDCINDLQNHIHNGTLPTTANELQGHIRVEKEMFDFIMHLQQIEDDNEVRVYPKFQFVCHCHCQCQFIENIEDK